MSNQYFKDFLIKCADLWPDVAEARALAFWESKRSNLSGEENGPQDAYRHLLEVVAKPHKHFFNVTKTQASWKKATNILI